MQSPKDTETLELVRTLNKEAQGSLAAVEIQYAAGDVLVRLMDAKTGHQPGQCILRNKAEAVARSMRVLIGMLVRDEADDVLSAPTTEAAEAVATVQAVLRKVKPFLRAHDLDGDIDWGILERHPALRT